MKIDFVDEYMVIRKKIQRYNFLLQHPLKTQDQKKEVSDLEQFQENLLLHLKDLYEIIEKKKLYIMQEKKENFFKKNIREDF